MRNDESLTVACVWTGYEYGREYIERLAVQIARHLPRAHSLICLTDRADALPEGVRRVPVGNLGLPGWWAKMALFDPANRRPNSQTLYFDLDTVIIGDLTPLAELQTPFAICANFTRLRQSRGGRTPTWPCKYGSCIMSLGAGFGFPIWRDFDRRRAEIMAACPRGDQEAIQRLLAVTPDLLQEHLPPGFFLHYRDLDLASSAPPPATSIVVYGGRHKPHNFGPSWARAAWRAAA